MNSKDPAGPNLKTKAIHELREFAIISGFLAFFFCALTTYSMLILRAFHIQSSSYAFAIINALVIAKVILIGEYAKLGRRLDSKPLIYSAIFRAFLYSLLVLCFHFLEEVIKRLIHGEAILSIPSEIHLDEMLARGIVVFCVFIPLFAFRDLRRRLGEDRFKALVFGSAKVSEPDQSLQ